MIVKFGRYILTGGSAAILDLVGFRLLLAVGWPIGFSACLSWLAAAFANYYLTSRFVFQRSTTRKGAINFLIGAAIGMSINVGSTLFLSFQLGLDDLLCKAGGIGIAFIFNFFINLLWIFR